MIVSVRDLHAEVGGHPLFTGLSFEVRTGEIFAILGRSGAGKSQLLRYLLGLDCPLAGTCEVLGSDLARASQAERTEVRRHLGVAFQGGALLNALSVRDNVELPLRHHARLDAATRRIMVHLKLELLNLSGIDHLRPAELSGGMLKRVSIARAVVMDPPLIFLDEPTAGLDPINANELDALLVKLRDALHTTIVFVTHAVESALAIADRVLVLQEGRAVALGSPAQIQGHPSPSVQALLGRAARRIDNSPEAYLDRLTAGDD
ncbi:MAG: ABC transporter ATP-binding protein [Gammaproteobacteria bacterium]